MSKKVVLLQPLSIRFFTWGLLVIITLQIFTGLLITFPVSFLCFKLVRGLHIFLIYPLLFWLIGRIYYAVVTGDYKNIVPTLNEVAVLPQFLKYELYLTDKKPPQGKYNIGQKNIYFSWGIAIIFQLITGFALFDNTLFRFLDPLVGGYIYIRWYHYLATLYFLATVMVHLYFIFS